MESIIRQGELVGMGLMAYETTEEVGTVDHLLVDVSASEVVGFACKAGGALGGPIGDILGRKQSVSWAQLVKIGRDRIVIHTAVPPSERTEEKLAAAQNVIGLEVWTDGGDLIGQVVDFCLEVDSGKVQQYLFALNARDKGLDESLDAVGSGKLKEDSKTEAHESEVSKFEESKSEVSRTIEVFAIAPSTIISAGRKRMMIAEEDAKRAQPYGQPIAIRPNRADSPLDWRADQLPTDFNEVLQGAQSFAGKVTERVRQQAKKFSDEQFVSRLGASEGYSEEPGTLPEITEQLQAKTEQVKRQMQQRFAQAKDIAREQVEELNDSSVGRSISQRLGAQFDKFVQPRTAEPKEPIDVEAFEVWEDD